MSTVLKMLANVVLGLAGQAATRDREARLRGAIPCMPPMRVTVSEYGEPLFWACSVVAYSKDFLLVTDEGCTFDGDELLTAGVPLRFLRSNGKCIDQEGLRLNDNDLLDEVRKHLRAENA